MKISVLGPSDAIEYWELRKRALKEDPDGFSTTYEESMQRPNPIEQTEQRLQSSDYGFTVGAFNEENKLVGVATFMRESSLKLMHKGNIFAMYVASEERGKGIAKKLLIDLISRAKQFNGLEQINLTVVTTNEGAIKLYQSLGFEIYGTEKNGLKYGNQYWDEYFMALRL